MRYDLLATSDRRGQIAEDFTRKKVERLQKDCTPEKKEVCYVKAEKHQGLCFAWI
jgi:hypothetical protein